MDMGCNEGDCEQSCKAEKICDLKCSGKSCKKQECRKKVDNCTMHMICNEGECEQSCKAKTKCDLKCSGKSCRKQECSEQVDNCTMDMGCNEGDCEQICKAKKNCDMKCFGCTQSCKASTCRMTKTWPNSDQEKFICSGNGQCCRRFTTTYDTSSLKTMAFSTKCSGHKSCACTKYSKNLLSTSNLNTSNVVTSTKAKYTRVFATNTPAGHGTEAYTSQRTLMQSPSSLISPSPLPSLSSSCSSLVATVPAETSASSFTPSLSSSLSSKPAAVSLEEASSDVAPSLSSSSLSPPAASKSAVSASSISSSSSSPSSVAAALVSTSLSASSSAAPNDSFSGKDGIEIGGNSSSTNTHRKLKSFVLLTRVQTLTYYFNKNCFKLLQEAIKVFEDFITSIQTIPKRKEEIEIERKSIFNAAVALEKSALDYGKYHLTEGNSSVEISSHKLVLAIQKAYRKNASDFYLGRQELQASMKLSSLNFVNNVSVVVGILYKDLHEVLSIDQPFTIKTGNTRYLDSGMMAVSTDPKPEKIQENVTLNFRNLNVHEGGRKCMFWSGLNESSGGLSARGCYVVASESNSEETVCSCDHLTHFAVLVDYNGSPGLTEEDETILEIITYVGLSLSILGIFLTIILYSFLTDIWQPLSQIRLSLSVALGTGQIIFLAGINATENTTSCIIAAAFLQYFLMAAFCWMFVDGIYFYLFLVKVYNVNTKMHMYHVISWGLPIIMVVISLSIASGKDGIQSFTSEKYCWLSSTNSLIWIFVTFVASVEVVSL
ncbi:uncharacterized protein LOC111338930 [Stylophora pistillata]|uniref:uncharacterized protein LOC111338930 n=1 Tax=Stylophora pistillata TaxID=50429 RepID=UPI000C03D6FE|nr:uncharacterized protein LOC111338930 [Stylophora pistillata]